jgi:hypothetical protein
LSGSRYSGIPWNSWLVRFDEALLFEIASAYEAGTKDGRRTDSGR